MADIHHVITLGIGEPADIPHFTLFGLSPTGVVDTIDALAYQIIVTAEDRTVLVLSEDRTILIEGPAQ